jgi:hypothetical protein
MFPFPMDLVLSNSFGVFEFSLISSLSLSFRISVSFGNVLYCSGILSAPYFVQSFPILLINFVINYFKFLKNVYFSFCNLSVTVSLSTEI